MGNHVIVRDDSGCQVGSMNHGMGAFIIVKNIVDKYQPGDGIKMLLNPEVCNDILDPVYGACELWEDVQLRIFINDEAEYDEADIPALKEAIANDTESRYIKTFEFMLALLEKHKKLTTKYEFTDVAMAIGKTGQ
jgi:hypothetical protein